MTFGSLFAGVGGFDLGFEWAGMECAWQVEIDPFCRRVLEARWPHVRRHDDIRSFPPGDPDDWRVDVVCGGFPCQDISSAGRRAGLDGSKSGLWFEFARVVRVLRPQYVVVENSSELVRLGLSRVLGNLADMGFDAEWAVLPASAFGALHIRARTFVVAYSQRGRRHGLHEREQARRLAADAGIGGEDGPDRAAAADPQGFDAAGPDSYGQREPQPPWVFVEVGRRLEHVRETVGRDLWAIEPDVGRMAHGVPDGVDRRRGLGNAVSPIVAKWLGRRIVERWGMNLAAAAGVADHELEAMRKGAV